MTSETAQADPFSLLAQAATEDRRRRDENAKVIHHQLDAYAQMGARRDESAMANVEAFRHQIEALEQAYARGLTQALAQLRTSAENDDSRQQEIINLFSALSAAAGAEGEQTRQKIADAMAHARTLLIHVKDAKSATVNLEHVITTAVAMARDQLAERVDQLATDRRQDAEAAAARDADVSEALVTLDKIADENTAVLGKVSFDVDQLTRDVPTHSKAVIAAVKEGADQNGRQALDMEQRLNQALNVSGERTEGAMRQTGAAIREMSSALSAAAEERALARQTLTSIAGDLGHLAGEFEAHAEGAATAAAVESVRGDVNALGELLAQTTDSFETAVTGAVDTLVQLRTAWSEETRRVLMTLEEMGRVFLEKANGSEHARDEAVIELGRRVARLELDRPAAAITAGS